MSVLKKLTQITVLIGAFLCLSTAAACGEGDSGARATATRAAGGTATPTASATGGGGGSYPTLAEMSHAYGAMVLAPVGVPVAAPDGVWPPLPAALEQYGYYVFGQLGGVHVFGPAPTPLSYDHDWYPDPRSPLIQKRTVTLDGTERIFLQAKMKEDVSPQHYDDFAILWDDHGLLFDAHAVAQGGFNGPLAVGPDALEALVEALTSYTPQTVDAAGITTVAMPFDPAGADQFTSATTLEEAESSYGAPVAAPPQFTDITVLHSGAIRSYSVALDGNGVRMLYMWPQELPWPDASEATAPGVAALEDVTVDGSPAVYERVDHTGGTTSLLFFSIGGTEFQLRDATGGSSADLVALAETVQFSGAAPTAVAGSLAATPGVASATTVPTAIATAAATAP